MKFIIALLLTAFLGYVAPLFSFMPWWSFAITSLLVALAIHQKGFKAFLAGFIAMFLVWGIYSWMIDAANGHILSSRVAKLFSLGDNGIIVVLIAALIAGLVSGFAALTGSYLRSMNRKQTVIERRAVRRTEEVVN